VICLACGWALGEAEKKGLEPQFSVEQQLPD
jgi:hypothetical protein